MANPSHSRALPPTPRFGGSATHDDEAPSSVVLTSRRSRGALALIEITGLAAVHEHWGMIHGDQVLLELAQRFRRAAGEASSVSRAGLHQFAVVLREVRGAPPIPERIAAIVEAASAPVQQGPIIARLGAAIGVAELDSDAEQTQQKARVALHTALRDGGEPVFYSDELAAKVEARARLLADVRRGAEAGEFILHYQPVCDVEGRCCGFEALMRWQHRERGLLAPPHFLAAFEDPALSVVLGDLAIRTAVEQMRTWMEQGIDYGYVAVNLAAEQLAEGNLPGLVESLLRRHCIAPSRLMLEVTESVCLDKNATRILTALRRLREIGVSLALDDFGTGYASLSHLKLLTVDRMKVDRSFVQNVCESASDAAIVRAIISIGRSLGIEVVAEGVETGAQLRFLRQAGCTSIQGFYFARPLPPEEAARYTQRQPPPSSKRTPR